MPENGLWPIHDTAPSDIFVCAYPRSGNTWFQNLVAGVAHGVDPEFAHDSLIQDLVPGVNCSRFCEFAGLKRPDAHLEYIAAKASFDKARAKELQMEWDNKLWPREQAFIRRGVVGSYRDEMPPQVLAAFVEKAGTTLARFGYK
jgi:hypothetical protein